MCYKLERWQTFPQERWQPLRSADSVHFFPALSLQPLYFPTFPWGADRNGDCGSQFLPLPMERNHPFPRGWWKPNYLLLSYKKTLHRYHQGKNSCTLLPLLLPHSFELNEELLCIFCNHFSPPMIHILYSFLQYCHQRLYPFLVGFFFWL